MRERERKIYKKRERIIDIRECERDEVHQCNLSLQPAILVFMFLEILMSAFYVCFMGPS